MFRGLNQVLEISSMLEVCLLTMSSIERIFDLLMSIDDANILEGEVHNQNCFKST
jgi:hypothetical protein